MNLKKKKVQFSLEAMTQEIEKQTSYIYLVELVDIYGKAHKVWGYGLNQIMLSTVPDMSSLQCKFPHVPGTAFQPLLTNSGSENYSLRYMRSEVKPVISQSSNCGFFSIENV